MQLCTSTSSAEFSLFGKYESPNTLVVNTSRTCGTLQFERFSLTLPYICFWTVHACSTLNQKEKHIWRYEKSAVSEASRHEQETTQLLIFSITYGA